MPGMDQGPHLRPSWASVAKRCFPWAKWSRMGKPELRLGPSQLSLLASAAIVACGPGLDEGPRMTISAADRVLTKLDATYVEVYYSADTGPVWALQGVIGFDEAYEVPVLTVGVGDLQKRLTVQSEEPSIPAHAAGEAQSWAYLTAPSEIRFSVPGDLEAGLRVRGTLHSGQQTNELTATPRAPRPEDPWLAADALTFARLLDVSYTDIPDLFVAVGEGGVMRKSVDGRTWTSITSPTSEAIIAVESLNPAVANGSGHEHWRAIAGGLEGEILASVDGTSWTAVASGVLPLRNHVRAIVQAAGSLMVAGAGFVSTSTSGESWKQRTFPENEFSIEDLSRGPGLSIIAVGYRTAGSRDGLIYASADDNTHWADVWAERVEGVSHLHAVREVVFHASIGARYVAVGESGTVLVSDDAIEWVSKNIDPRYAFFDVIDCNGLLFALAHIHEWQASVVLASADADSWYVSKRSPSPLTALACGSTRHTVVVGDNGYVATLPGP